MDNTINSQLRITNYELLFHRLTLVPVLIVALLLPMTCDAATTTTWNLMNIQKLEGWNTNNLTTVNLIPQGLAISTETQGQLVKVSDIKHHVDAISITYISPSGGQGVFFWRAPGMAEEEVYQIPMTFTQSTTQQKVILNMSKVSKWDARSDRIGFILNANTQLVLQEMSFSGPSILDKIIFPLKTFFKFDITHAYSINFLWGPLMTYSQEQLDTMYSQVPPNGDSWNKAFYALLAAGLVLVLLLKKLFHKNSIVAFFIMVAALWMVYDLRMGTEFISFARTDVRTWWSKPLELKDFRDRSSFTAFAQTAAPFTKDKENYVFIASHGWPFWGSMQYEAYPALPISYEADTTGIDTWIIFNRKDITVNEEGRLVLNQEPISPPGDIMMNFQPGSFIFVTR